MYAVESRNIREQLEFRIKSLRATNLGSIADLILYDLEKIMQNEIFVTINHNDTLYAERLRKIRENNND